MASENSYPTLASASNNEIPEARASQACLSCRKQKRKCNKGLPACALCARMGRHCDYSDASPTPTSEDFQALRQRLLDLESRLLANGNGNNVSQYPTPATEPPLPPHNENGPVGPSFSQPEPVFQNVQNVQNRFPPIAFLDADTCRYGGVTVPKPSFNIPMEVLDLLGDGLAVQAIVNEYFSTVHTWLPILSKKRMTQNMMNPLWEAGPDLALLFLCMKLIITKPPDGLECGQIPVYGAAKRFLALMETSGMVSLLVLQSWILVTLYETGQAIYPAAWMSAGSCIRYGILLGLNGRKEATPMLARPNTWTEAEERRRTWWGVVIIDNLSLIGVRGYAPALDYPWPEDQLPYDDIAWDNGDMGLGIIPTLNNPLTDPQTPFGRLCQANSLLSRVTRHHASHPPTPDEIPRFNEAYALFKELEDFAKLLTHEANTSSDYLSHIAPLAFTFSALCNLADPYACPPGSCHTVAGAASKEGGAIQVMSVAGLKTVGADVVAFVDKLLTCTQSDRELDRVSPLVLNAMYTAAAEFAWFARESGDEGFQRGLDRLREGLRRLGARWRGAAEYIRILEAQEFQYAIGAVGP